jgi:DNA topoisomerase-1
MCFVLECALMARNYYLLTTDPVDSAKIAGLRYISDRTPGIRRIGSGKNFRYRNADGKLMRDKEILKRIRSLVIPPAWTDVWISRDPQSHLQAVGRDARGRKQYRYHSRWRETRDSTKYHRLVIFGEALPRIRARVSRDLNIRELKREKVIATIVRLLETTSIRVGNEEYSRQNNSFGLTTLRDRHVRVSSKRIDFFFRGKSGVRHEISVENRRLARIVRQLRDLPGYELFQYIDENGEVQSIDSMHVNVYIREVSHDDFTAKDFRTWNGTVLAAEALTGMPPCTSQKMIKKNMAAAVQFVAGQLGNTAAVCRKCYIHPAVFEGYMARSLWTEADNKRPLAGLSALESSVLRFLKKTLREKPGLEKSLRNSLRKNGARTKGTTS